MFFDDGIEPRKLGCRPRVAAVGSVAPIFGASDRAPLIPRSQWREVSWRQFAPPTKDQNGVGACNAFAGITVLESLRVMSGQSYVELSPGWLYGDINGGRDEGSLLSDAKASLCRRGACRASIVRPLDWHPRQWPREAEEDALNYRIDEWWDCPTFDHLASAIQDGFLCDYGILLGDNFKPDRDGVIPHRRGSAGGHALAGFGLKRIGRDWYIETLNSWTSRWGAGGWCFVPESYFQGEFNDAWAQRTAIWSPGQAA